tara:strand:+ start:213 stop:458 length:246 start_codon:yes stop_codon:yes gene_type:complete
MANKKKPTIMEVKNVINNVIHYMTELQSEINKTNAAFQSYVEFKGDKEKWIEAIKATSEKLNKGESNESNGTKPRDSIRED